MSQHEYTIYSNLSNMKFGVKIFGVYGIISTAHEFYSGDPFPLEYVASSYPWRFYV